MNIIPILNKCDDLTLHEMHVFQTECFHTLFVASYIGIERLAFNSQQLQTSPDKIKKYWTTHVLVHY